jgi:hypothetical protein
MSPQILTEHEAIVVQAALQHFREYLLLNNFAAKLTASNGSQFVVDGAIVDDVLGKVRGEECRTGENG